MHCTPPILGYDNRIYRPLHIGYSSIQCTYIVFEIGVNVLHSKLVNIHGVMCWTHLTVKVWLQHIERLFSYAASVIH